MTSGPSSTASQAASASRWSQWKSSGLSLDAEAAKPALWPSWRPISRAASTIATRLRQASAARFRSWRRARCRPRKRSTSSSGIFATAPNLKDLLENETADTISLASGVDITIRPASFRTIRGITAVAAIADEIAFWRSDDSANPDTEILRALRPALATTGGLLAAISSPHAKRGELYSARSSAISGRQGIRQFLSPRRPAGR